ncbi:coiled-coil domain-containing protein 135, partial [Cystoisospora suis]
FRTIYGPRFLFLAPPNEFGVAKFVSTTIRPTKIPFKECYDYRECAEFFSDFLSYEELEPPNQYPPVLPAPTSVISWRKGDSFDYAVLLCSVLIGQGYEAYCVSGCAPVYITKINQTSELPPFVRHQMEDEARKKEKTKAAANLRGTGVDGSSEDDSAAEEDRVILRDDDDEILEFIVPKRLAPESIFLKMLQEQKEEEEAAIKAENEQIFVENGDIVDTDDPYEGERIHCWVLIKKGKRGVQEDVFIEPTTGRVYSLPEAPYVAVHFVWNHENFWVNMQMRSPVRQLQWDLYNTRFFEYILLKKSGVLQAPLSWADRFELTRDDIIKRYYGLSKTTFYKKCKVECFALYSQPDGLVKRVTLFKDCQRTLIYQIWETFKQRRDCMVERIRYPDERKVIERYLPGTPSSLKEVIEVEAIKRELLFYKSRLDGLVRHVEVIGVKMFEEFEGREDRRIYQSITLGDDLDSAREKIRKDASEDESKIVYYLPEEKVRISYHHAEGSIIEPVLMLKRKQATLEVDEEYMAFVKTFQRDVPDEKQLHRYLMRQKEIVMRFRNFVVDQAYQIHVWRGQQEAAITAARELEERHLLGLRDSAAAASRPLSANSNGAQGGEKEGGDSGAQPGSEGAKPEETAAAPVHTKHTLQPTVYDAARELLKNHVEEKEAQEAQQKQKESEEIDILAPYFVEFRGRALDAATAELIAKRCKNDMRKRMLHRAAVIQQRLQEQQEKLKRLKEAQQRRMKENNHDTGFINKEEEEGMSIEEQQSEIVFKIRILEQRLHRHEVQAMTRLNELERLLLTDSRLAPMWTKEAFG